MRDSLFHLKRDPSQSIQAQIRGMLVSIILDGHLPPGSALPSYRKMARLLGVSRNTVVLAYQGLVDDGYLTARERSGYYVCEDILNGRAAAQAPGPVPDGANGAAAPAAGLPDWERRFRLAPSRLAYLDRPRDWRSYPYPFIYGQIDPSLFPLAEWRECCRQSLSKSAMEDATSDYYGYDDPELVDQIRTRLLPRRGIRAGADQILITMGAQNAIYLLASLLVTPDTRIALEDPGYRDVRNIFAVRTNRLRPVAVDDGGLPVDDRLNGIDYVFVTPSHQSPTMVTLPMDRREALLAKAVEQNFLIIEDDYEAEANYVSEPTPAIKSIDRHDR
ncbi:MAG: PLP-dependent aminotransferase family protein, partial [Rhodobacterales bacterium]|nr:PLP-dependent aminotransferase family protein [Rhodobacterales bacterium]